MFSFKSFKDFLWRTSMPIWFSLCVGLATGVAGGVGAYILVPHINHELQMQRVRSEYLQENIRNLNTETRKLVENLTVFSHKAIEEDKIDGALRRDIISNINKLNWRVIELDIVFSTVREEKLLDSYKKAAERLRNSIEKVEDKDDLENVFPKAETFSARAYQLLAELYRKAELKAEVDPELTFQPEKVKDKTRKQE